MLSYHQYSKYFEPIETPSEQVFNTHEERTKLRQGSQSQDHVGQGTTVKSRFSQISL